MFEILGVDPANSSAQLITCDQRVENPFVAANLTLSEFSSSTSNDWFGFHVVCSSVDPFTAGILNVFVGPPGSEQRVATLPARYLSRNNQGISTFVPVSIASGSRVTVGISGNLFDDYRVQIVGCIDGLFLPKRSFSFFDCGPFILEDVATTYAKGVPIDPGPTINTKPAYAQITYSGDNAINNLIDGSSLSEAYDALGFIVGESLNSAQTTQSRLWEFARGAPGSEISLGDSLLSTILGAETQLPLSAILGEWGRPSGDEISARFQCSLNDATDRIGSAFIVGVR